MKTRSHVVSVPQRGERATCCTLSPSWLFPGPCPWSFHSPLYIWGNTICPWVCGGARRRRSETTRWDIHRCHSRSSRHRTPAHTGSTWARLDLSAGPEERPPSQTSPLTFSSSWRMSWPSFPVKLPRLQGDPDLRNFRGSLRFSAVLSVSLLLCRHYQSQESPPPVSSHSGWVCPG